MEKLPEKTNLKNNYYIHKSLIPFINKISLSDNMFPKNTSCKVKILNITLNPLIDYEVKESNINASGKINYKIKTEFTFITSDKKETTALIFPKFTLNLDRYISSIDEEAIQNFYVYLSCKDVNCSLIYGKFKNELNKLIFKGEFKFHIIMEYKGDIKNGSFEKDLDNWIIPLPSANLVTSVKDFNNTLPMEGEKFAVLTAEGENSSTLIYQQFHGKKGDTLKGYSFFLSGDIPLFDNFAEIVIKNKSDSFEEIIFKASVNSTGNTPWSLWSYELKVEDDYILEARVKNQGDPIFQSVLALDGIHLLKT